MFKVNNINGDYFNVASSAGSILGSAVHKGLQKFFGGVPDETTSVITSEALKEGYEYGLKFLQDYNESFIEFSDKISTRESLIEKYSFCYFGMIADANYSDLKQDSVLLVEKTMKHTVEIDGKLLPVPLKGIVDMVWRDEQGRIIIDDYKIKYTFSKDDKIDGQKLIQAIFYFFLVWAELGEKPYAIRFMEYKYSKNRDAKESQLHPYMMPYDDISIAFDLFFRMYEDVTDALLGKQVYVPNFNDLYDNEVSIIAYINGLDKTETREAEFKKEKVTNITDFINKKIQKSSQMKKYLEIISKKFISGNSLNYKDMDTHDRIKMKLAEHGIALDFDSKISGSTVTLYCYEPTIGLKMSRIEQFVKDIEQVVEKSGVRILAPIPNTGLIGIEVPNEERVFPELPKNKGFELSIGETVMGQVRRFDITQAPHMFVAGATGSGKSVFLNNIIKQLLTVPRVELYLFDPKRVELSHFADENKVKQYLSDGHDIALQLQSLVFEMDNRYDVMRQSKVKNISEMQNKMNYKFVIIDEYADLIMGTDKEISNAIQTSIMRLAQKGRACGIHLIVATQRASTKVISGDIKINFPTKVVFKMSKEIDSRVMIDQAGAEKLLGKGDCLFVSDYGVERLQAYSDL